jgi:sterol 14-demethylase
MAHTTAELDALYADGRDVSYQALREIPVLESCFKETLRLHPPLVLLMRKAMQPFSYGKWTVPAGKTVGVSISVSNRDPALFADPHRFDPTRYDPDRREDDAVFGWIPFGAGRHRCVGAAFAMMQVKAIFSILLRRYEFALAQPPETYREDHSKMVVQLAQPCRVTYRRRKQPEAAVTAASHATEPRSATHGARVTVDLDLCQGHAVCVSECPEVFRIDAKTKQVELLDATPPPALRSKLDAAIRHCPTRAIRVVEE